MESWSARVGGGKGGGGGWSGGRVECKVGRLEGAVGRLEGWKACLYAQLALPPVLLVGRRVRGVVLLEVVTLDMPATNLAVQARTVP